MKILVNKLLTLILFLAAIFCAYLAITVPFAMSFINIALFFVAIFLFIQACGLVDKEQGYGKYSNKDEKEKDGESDKEAPETQENIVDNEDC